MSRIGKKTIIIPENVEVNISDHEVIVKGPKGELNFKLPTSVIIKKTDQQLLVSVDCQKKKSKQFGEQRGRLLII